MEHGYLDDPNYFFTYLVKVYKPVQWHEGAGGHCLHAGRPRRSGVVVLLTRANILIYIYIERERWLCVSLSIHI